MCAFTHTDDEEKMNFDAFDEEGTTCSVLFFCAFFLSMVIVGAVVGAIAAG